MIRYPAARSWAAAGVLLAVSLAAVIAPWTIRNYVQFHRFIPVNGQGEGILEWNVSHADIPGEPPGALYIAEMYGKDFSESRRKMLLLKYV